MKSKQQLSIEEQLAIASAGAAPKSGSQHKSVIEIGDDVVLDSETKKSLEKKSAPPVEQKSVIDELNTPSYSAPVEPTPQPAPTNMYTPQPASNNTYIPPAPPQAPIYQVEQPAPVEPTVQPQFTAPTQHPTMPKAMTTTHFNTTLNADSIAIMLAMCDMYREMDGNVQEVIKRFVQVDKNLDTSPEQLSQVIYGILQVSDRQKVGLTDLVSLKEEERTSRAFSLISLSDDRLEAIQELTILFNNDFTPQNNVKSNKILFCRELENGIETLSSNTLSLLKPIDSLFELLKFLK